MEINAANVAQHKIFPGKPSFVDKKKMDEKADLVSYPRKKYKKLWTVPESTKKATKVGMGLFNGTYQLIFNWKL